MKEEERINKYAEEIMKLAKDTLVVHFRFLDAAIACLKTAADERIGGFALEGDVLYYNPRLLLKEYLDEPGIAVRGYLHVLLHCIFMHQKRTDKANEGYWSLAVDIAVENMILELDIQAAALSVDDEKRSYITRLKKNVPMLTAELLYRDFCVYGLSAEYEAALRKCFTVDTHDAWRTKRVEERISISEEQWKEIARRVKTDLGTFSKGKNNSEVFDAELEEVTRERYDYRQILERFAISGEEMTVNDDEFDYIYYTLGLRSYGNMPLIEPLEYKEEIKVREFVIAIDTSGSCSGELVRKFIKRTYELLKESESFFREVNIRIIQCDNEVRHDAKICNDEDFKAYLAELTINGNGSTDFRPVFSYVDRLIAKGEFSNLRGLIYFTDGYGVYPEKMPDYEVIFAFMNEDGNRERVPVWALKVIMEDELSEYK